ADHDVVRGGEELARLVVLAGERAEDELRHRHVRRRLDPVARHVAEDDREPAVREAQVVVDVTADVHPRRRLVDRAELQTLEVGRARGNERAWHLVRGVRMSIGWGGYV